MKTLLTFLVLSTSLSSQESPDGEHLKKVEINASEAITTHILEKIQKQIPVDTPVQPTLKKPWIAVSLATIFPGLGHVYLGDMETAAAFAGGAAFGFGTGLRASGSPGAMDILLTTVNFKNYTVYAAYRDARAQVGMSGFSYEMPRDSLKDLVLAPFRPKILKKPEVWGGVLGSLAAGLVLIHATREAKINLSASVYTPHPIVAFPVGIGEEALFRGAIQPAMIESFGVRGGITTSSILFGASHIPNAIDMSPQQRMQYFTYSIPFISALGGYMGWVTHKNRSLQESVAIHAWYDFTLFTLSSLATASIQGPRSDTMYSISIPF